MNINEFEKIKLKLEKYDLVNSIDNISKWFRRLKEKHINNFLMLNYSDELKKYNKLLLDTRFLGKENYLKDIELIRKYDNENVDVDMIYNLLTDQNFLASKNHINDLKLILSSGNNVKKYLIKIARSTKSMGKDIHLIDMKMLFEFDSYYKNNPKDNHEIYYENFVSYVTNPEVLNFKMNKEEHIKDAKLILLAKTSNISDEIKLVVSSLDSLKSKYHRSDIELVYNAKNDYIAHMLADTATNNFSLNSSFHENDMKMISNAKNDETALSLKNCATNKYSLLSPNHLDYMNLISECMEKENLKYLLGLFSYSFLSNENHLSKMKMVANAYPDKAYMICNLVIDEKNEKLFDINKIVEFINYNTFEVSKLFYELILDYKNDKQRQENINNLYNELCNLKTNEEKLCYLNSLKEKNKRKEVSLLTNKEKLDIIYNNALKYVDANKKDELNKSVFIIK